MKHLNAEDVFFLNRVLLTFGSFSFHNAMLPSFLNREGARGDPFKRRATRVVGLHLLFNLGFAYVRFISAALTFCRLLAL